jgi:ADP-ribose pyrophosphatase
VRLPSGAEVPYTVYEDQKNYPTIIPEFEDGRFLLVREYKYPANVWTYQFPEGKTGEDENTEEAAAKELREETGYEANRLEVIGENLHHHRRQKTKNIIYIARGLKRVSSPKLELEEQGMTIHIVSATEIDRLILDGDFAHKSAQTAWAIYQAYKRTQPDTL